MANCSKPANAQFMAVSATEKKKQIMALGRLGRAVGTHLRTLEDTMNIFAWFMLPEKADDFKEMLGDFFGNIDFNG